jgi:predicted TIM-barrel fold metal-dependent hydrolase
MWDEVHKYLLPSGKNVYFDTAYVSHYMSDREMEQMIRDIGPERVIYGSDYPWAEPGVEAKIIENLGFSLQEREAILWGNAAKLMMR